MNAHLIVRVSVVGNCTLQNQVILTNVGAGVNHPSQAERLSSLNDHTSGWMLNVLENSTWKPPIRAHAIRVCKSLRLGRVVHPAPTFAGFYLPLDSQTGSGFSTATHFTFLSFRFETRYGFSVARSPGFTCTSQFQVALVDPISVERMLDSV
jgi:hypothetical protein